MKKTILLHIALFFSALIHAQSNNTQIQLGTIKTELKNNAISVGIKYLKSLDSTFKQQDILIAKNKSLFKISPSFNVQTGTEDIFSNIDAKLNFLFLKFATTTVDGIVTPDPGKLLHCFPFAAGVESNHTFSFVNAIAEGGYVPWYQSPVNNKIPDWVKHTKLGLFVQTGYKFEIDQSDSLNIGGELEEGKEKTDEILFRGKGIFVIDTQRLFSMNGVGVGLTGNATGWYDLMNEEFYYSLEGCLRFYLASDKSKYFDLKYQKGSGAPNFNTGDQFGMNLTVTF